MLTFHDTYKSVEDFALSIISGAYNRQIYDYLSEIALDLGYVKFKAFNPLSAFEFEIELKDIGKLIYIAPWKIDNCLMRGPVMSTQEHNIFLLIRALIRDKYNSILKCQKYSYERSFQK